jgi:hypothetical protein
LKEEAIAFIFDKINPLDGRGIVSLGILLKIYLGVALMKPFFFSKIVIS